MTNPELKADCARVVRAIHLLGDSDSLCNTRSTRRMPTCSEYEALSRQKARAGGITGIELSEVGAVSCNRRCSAALPRTCVVRPRTHAWLIQSEYASLR